MADLDAIDNCPYLDYNGNVDLDPLWHDDMDSRSSSSTTYYSCFSSAHQSTRDNESNGSTNDCGDPQSLPVADGLLMYPMKVGYPDYSLPSPPCSGIDFTLNPPDRTPIPIRGPLPPPNFAFRSLPPPPTAQDTPTANTAPDIVAGHLPLEYPKLQSPPIVVNTPAAESQNGGSGPSLSSDQNPPVTDPVNDKGDAVGSIVSNDDSEQLEGPEYSPLDQPQWDTIGTEDLSSSGFLFPTEWQPYDYYSSTIPTNLQPFGTGFTLANSSPFSTEIQNTASDADASTGYPEFSFGTADLPFRRSKSDTGAIRRTWRSRQEFVRSFSNKDNIQFTSPVQLPLHTGLIRGEEGAVQQQSTPSIDMSQPIPTVDSAPPQARPGSPRPSTTPTATTSIGTDVFKIPDPPQILESIQSWIQIGENMAPPALTTPWQEYVRNIVETDSKDLESAAMEVSIQSDTGTAKSTFADTEITSLEDNKDQQKGWCDDGRGSRSSGQDPSTPMAIEKQKDSYSPTSDPESIQPDMTDADISQVLGSSSTPKPIRLVGSRRGSSSAPLPTASTWEEFVKGLETDTNSFGSVVKGPSIQADVTNVLQSFITSGTTSPGDNKNQWEDLYEDKGRSWSFATEPFTLTMTGDEKDSRSPTPLSASKPESIQSNTSTAVSTPTVFSTTLPRDDTYLRSEDFEESVKIDLINMGSVGRKTIELPLDTPLTSTGKKRKARSPTPPPAKRARGSEVLPAMAESLSPVVSKKTDSDDGLSEQAMEICTTDDDSLTDRQQRVKLIIARLTDVFRDVKLYRELLKHRDTEAQMLLDVFQMLLDTPSLLAEFKSNLLVATQRLSKSAGLYPASYNLQNVMLESDDPVAAGSFADIYKGRFQGKVVCLKVIRLYQTSHADAFLKQFCTEAILWSQLSHPSLLPVYGLYRYSGRVCLVSPWMEYGDVTSFLSQYPNECRTLLVIDVASGIDYLHTHDIIHGDLKGVNILVDSSRRACLADFGLSGVSEVNILHWTSHSSAASKGGSVRWQAPELFDFESETTVHNSKASDVYAFACVAYEIYTSTVPFAEITRDAAVMFKVQSGSRPLKPDASSCVWEPRRLTEGIWSLMKACWTEDPRARPSIKEAYGVLVEEGRAVDDNRPSANVDIMSPGHLRDSVDTHGELSSSIEAVLDRLGLS